MIANYHTHTWRCQHAYDEEWRYVETAIEKGLKILGFSDHTPVVFPDYNPRVRMSPDQLEDYVKVVLSLRDEYKHDIEIHLGFEVEYYPASFDAYLEMISPYPIEYLLLGQHFVGNEIGEPYSGHPTYSDDLLVRYCDQCKDALETGKFTYLAHPDLINYIGDNHRLYESSMRGLCQKAKELSIPLEINLLGIEGNRNYPNEKFWEIAGEEGNDVILGSDAHIPVNTANAEAEQKALQIVEKNHLHLLEKVALIDPLS